MELKRIFLNEKRNVNLTAILQGVGGEFIRVNRRPAVLVLPGGGYDMCSDIEAEPVALAYAKAGYQAFILRYSVGEHAIWPYPLEDYEQAVELIREHAEEWGIYSDKIVVVGFSAGGHLAACTAVMSKYRPNAAIIGYAPVGVRGSKLMESKQLPSPIDYVDQNTSPCFLFAARDDMLVTIDNTLEFQLALAKTNVTFESQVYAFGSHGFSTGEKAVKYVRTCSRVPNWVNDSIEWLKEIQGDFGNGELGEPEFGKKINDDLEPFLSVDCTIHRLKTKQELLDESLVPYLGILDNRGMEAERMEGPLADFVKNVRLRDMLLTVGITDEEIARIDAKLRKTRMTKKQLG